VLHAAKNIPKRQPRSLRRLQAQCVQPPRYSTATQRRRRPAALRGGRERYRTVVVPALTPDGASPLRKPSTGCGATQRRKNTNTWITGREAHQNARTTANATLIYSLKQADPGTHTHVPSGEARRTLAQPTRTVMRGPVPSCPRSWNRALWWPLQRIK